MIARPRPSFRARRGFALLAILWVMVGLAALGLGLQLEARGAVRVASNRVALAKARWAAEACAERARAAIADVLHEGGATAWSTLDIALRRSISVGPLVADSVTASTPTPPSGARCAAALRPVGTKLDINAADGETIARLLVAAGIAPTRADSLTSALLDWRDADDVARPAGAERAWYAAAGRTPPRNAPFADVRELARVRGFDSQAGIDSLFDVEPGRVVLDRSPAPVLAALPGFGDEAVSRVLERRARGAPVGDLIALAASLSPAARAAMLARYADLQAFIAPEPDAWILTTTGSAGTPAAASVVELRLVRAGDRAAIVRRRRWAR